MRGAALNGVDVFVAAVQTGSFAAAAERLHLTRSAVAKTIARVEGRLDVRLFHRTTRSQSLTEDGQIYYERCARALEELRAAELALDSGRRDASGRLRVSVPVLFGRRCVAPVLTRLAAQHPRLELDLSFCDHPVDLIEDGFDLVIRNGEIGNGAGLMARAISLQRMTVCAAPDYLAEHGRPETLEQLLAHHAVIYGRAGRTKAWQFPTGNGQVRELTPPSRLRLDDLEAIADAAEAGHGLAWLPCWLIRERVRQGQLAALLETTPRLVFRTHALWPATPHMPLRVRLAIDAIAAALPGSAEL
ncbi:LysR family transcriptional regulator [Xanthomonas theicola]|uniref:LysR family transcriptional regulator n=2 Tax=Xanthomonas theicola TaxID=56464 RepID=A0A2S6ZLC4_9XANT|nr:LysR family transcriptional regulator [Xanthomonas theicola]PPT93045.1 LysR family transcriptional regulator [Xanthomonas theicola]QNH26949.1 LysR family transcriptional regulator [Xanthomonas theicola]